MHVKTSQHRTRHRIRYILPICLTLAACVPETPTPPIQEPTPPASRPHHKEVNAVPASPRLTTDDYLAHLSSARLVFATHTHAAPPVGDIQAMRDYTAQPGITPIRQTVILLEYQTRGDNQRKHIIVPMQTAPGGDELPVLIDIMHKLVNAKYQLHDIHLATVVIPPLPIPDAVTRETLDELNAALLDSEQPLSSVEAVRLQLPLIRFFIHHRFQDAAYLTVDNTKRALAKAASADNAEAIQALSEELETLEAELHKVMPYRVSMPRFG